MKYVIAHAVTNIPHGEQKFTDPLDAEFVISRDGLDDHVVQIEAPARSTP